MNCPRTGSDEGLRYEAEPERHRASPNQESRDFPFVAGPRAAPTLPRVRGSGIFQRLWAPADRGLRHDEWVEPILAFFPGASGSSEFWRPVAERFSSRRTVQLLNWPGAGAEPHDRAIDGYDDLITYAAAAIPDRSDVVAQSMGGVVAIGLALSQPQKIRRLVLVATSGGLDVAGSGAEDWRAEYRREFPQAAAWVTGQHADFTDQLHRITIPTCLIWGDCDPVSPLAVGHALRDALSNSDFHRIVGGDHMLARERAEEVAALIAAHLP
jgi:pimeloyl-ACP methyl ester carboxylesterase